MKIGVVSDTHNNLKNVKKIIQIFNEKSVDRVVHTGDITTASTLSLFQELTMPLFGVFGNNDVEKSSLNEVIKGSGFTFEEASLNLSWVNRDIVVVHDPRDIDDLDRAFQVALHGHTHLYRCDRPTGDQVIFNPGECAGHMPGLNAVGIVDLTDLTTSLVHF